MSEADQNMLKITAASKAVTLDLDADVFVYFGPIDEPSDANFLTQVCGIKHRPNALLLLQTYGGSADAAYRIMKCLQRHYSKGAIQILIDGPCKSAGTLIAVGANTLIISDHGELGPLDVQLQKKDEVGEMSSGLTATQALNGLRTEAFNCFEQHLLLLRNKSGFQITTKTAAEIATQLTIGWFQPMYEQLDPMRIAEDQRSMMVASQYGTRLDRGNLRDNALNSLVASYPSHGFIIDREEATELFKDVRVPTELESALINALNDTGCINRALTGGQSVLGYINIKSDEDEKEGDKNDKNTAKPGGTTAEPESSVKQTIGTHDGESAEKAVTNTEKSSASLFSGIAKKQNGKRL